MNVYVDLDLLLNKLDVLRRDEINNVNNGDVNFRELQSCEIARMPVGGYSAEERGTTNTDSYKIFVRDSQGQSNKLLLCVEKILSGPVSPFHDIPLSANSDGRTFHIVVEVPR